MNTMPRLTHKFSILLLLLTAVFLLAACGTKIIRGAAPIVRLNELSHTGNGIELQLSMRNLNGETLDIRAIDFSLSVEGSELFSHSGPATTSIAANGTETWTISAEESGESKQLLDKLEAGEVKSLPYSLEGSIISAEDDKLHFSHDGHLYPVPGRPGQFR